MDLETKQSTLDIKPDHVGSRLDVVLADALQLSRSQSRKMLANGQVTLNQRIMTERDKGRTLAADDELCITGITDPAEHKPIAESELTLDVLAETNDYIAVNKPAGMPVHPLEPGETGTVLNAVIARYPQIAGVGEGALRCGVVHRLDTDTSGVLAFALTDDGFEQLRQAFTMHTTQKIYRAVVMGHLLGSGEESVHLVVAQHRPARVAVTDDADTAGARECRLAWRALAHGNGRTLIEVDLHTGFLHQIRATFAARGCPVLGDNRYGGQAADATRLMLHATSLRACALEATSPMPVEFEQALEAKR